MWNSNKRRILGKLKRSLRFFLLIQDKKKKKKYAEPFEEIYSKLEMLLNKGSGGMCKLRATVRYSKGCNAKTVGWI